MSGGSETFELAASSLPGQSSDSLVASIHEDGRGSEFVHLGAHISLVTTLSYIRFLVPPAGTSRKRRSDDNHERTSGPVSVSMDEDRAVKPMPGTELVEVGRSVITDRSMCSARNKERRTRSASQSVQSANSYVTTTGGTDDEGRESM